MTENRYERLQRRFRHWAKLLASSGEGIAKDFNDDEAGVVMLMRAGVEHGSATGFSPAELMGLFCGVLEGAMPGSVPQASTLREYEDLMAHLREASDENT
jgi:hypothetical protein